MCKLRYLLVAIFFAVVSAGATPIDPEIAIDSDPTVPTPVPGNQFSFTADSLGGGSPTFVNVSGVPFVSIDFSVILPQGDVITCTPGPLYAACVISSTDISNSTNALYRIGFRTGAGALAGILPGAGFRVLLDHPNGDGGGWGAFNSFNAVVNASPEPGSLGLLALAVGAGGFGLYRRRAAA